MFERAHRAAQGGRGRKTGSTSKRKKPAGRQMLLRRFPSGATVGERRGERPQRALRQGLRFVQKVLSRVIRKAGFFLCALVQSGGNGTRHRCVHFPVRVRDQFRMGRRQIRPRRSFAVTPFGRNACRIFPDCRDSLTDPLRVPLITAGPKRPQGLLFAANRLPKSSRVGSHVAKR